MRLSPPRQVACWAQLSPSSGVRQSFQPLDARPCLQPRFATLSGAPGLYGMTRHESRRLGQGQVSHRPFDLYLTAVTFPVFPSPALRPSKGDQSRGHRPGAAARFQPDSQARCVGGAGNRLAAKGTPKAPTKRSHSPHPSLASQPPSFLLPQLHSPCC